MQTWKNEDITSFCRKVCNRTWEVKGKNCFRSPLQVGPSFLRICNLDDLQCTWMCKSAVYMNCTSFVKRVSILNGHLLIISASSARTGVKNTTGTNLFITPFCIFEPQEIFGQLFKEFIEIVKVLKIMFLKSFLKKSPMTLLTWDKNSQES